VTTIPALVEIMLLLLDKTRVKSKLDNHNKGHLLSG
jgi:hypothetical protein